MKNTAKCRKVGEYMKPIFFNTPMVQAILNGRKSQTRRVIKPQPDGDVCFGICQSSTDAKSVGKTGFGNENVLKSFVSVKYHEGDILWVRETWGCYTDDWNDADQFVYKADYPNGAKGYWHESEKVNWCDLPKWKPSIHMPREAARIFLRVTDVRAERLQDITEEDAVSEGVSKMFDNLTDTEYEQWARNTRTVKAKPEWGYTNYLWHGNIGKTITAKQSDAWQYQCSGYESARDSFSSLWESVNAKRDYGWDINPWVWVISFERVELPRE